MNSALPVTVPVMAVYDALFGRGQIAHLERLRAAVESAEPGLDALQAGLEASGRWCHRQPADRPALFWRPVPRFEPSGDSMTPSIEMVRLQRQALRCQRLRSCIAPE